MKKSQRSILIVTMLFCLIISVVNVQGNEDTEPNTKVQVIVVTDGDLDAFFNGSANGSVNYYIDGVEVQGEFSSLWNYLHSLSKSLDDAQGSINNLHHLANENSNQISQQGEVIGEHDGILFMHGVALNDTRKNLIMIGDEIIAFEGAYFTFVNKTDATFSEQSLNIDKNAEEIDILRAHVNNINFIMLLLRNFIIGLIVIAFSLYIINKRYPLKDLIKRYNHIIKNGRPKPVYDFKSSAITGFIIQKLNLLTKIKVKRNPQKSPLRFFFSFLHINK